MPRTAARPSVASPFPPRPAALALWPTAHGPRPTPHAPRWLAGGLGSALVALIAYRRGSLSGSGAAGASVVGATLFAAGGTTPAALLLTFFVSSSALSHWRRERKEGAASELAKGGRRDIGQVAANGGAATALVVLGRLRPSSPWLPALVGALATVNADTWATEVGMLSRRPPRLVTTGREAPPGTSGAVSPVGTLAAALGAGLIGAVAALARGGDTSSGFRGIGRPEVVALGLVSGLAGAFADSLLGATVQARYRCPMCDVPTERTRHRCGAITELVGGWRWLDNDAVNFASSLVGAAVGWLWSVERESVERESVERGA